MGMERERERTGSGCHAVLFLHFSESPSLANPSKMEPQSLQRVFHGVTANEGTNGRIAAPPFSSFTPLSLTVIPSIYLC